MASYEAKEHRGWVRPGARRPFARARLQRLLSRSCCAFVLVLAVGFLHVAVVVRGRVGAADRALFARVCGSPLGLFLCYYNGVSVLNEDLLINARLAPMPNRAEPHTDVEQVCLRVCAQRQGET